jgi:hypothetical protein
VLVAFAQHIEKPRGINADVTTTNLFMRREQPAEQRTNFTAQRDGCFTPNVTVMTAPDVDDAV